jgi:hypothetical protein
VKVSDATRRDMRALVAVYVGTLTFVGSGVADAGAAFM